MADFISFSKLYSVHWRRSVRFYCIIINLIFLSHWNSVSLSGQDTKTPFIKEHLSDSLIENYELVSDKDSQVSGQGTIVRFDPDFKERYKGKDFEYSSTTHPLAKRIIRWFQRLIEKIFGQSKKADYSTLDVVINILMIIIFLSAIITIIRLILGKDAFSLLFQKEKRNAARYIDDGDLALSEKDLENLINDAISEKDFRLAVRFRYVLLLKTMSEEGLVDYHPEKTDREYLLEIHEQQFKELFQYLIYLYHRTWYGNYLIGEIEYAAVNQAFAKAKNMMQHG